MKINGSTSNAAELTNSGKTTGKSGASKAADSSSTSASVSLSDLSASLHGLSQTSSADTSFDAGKVEKIKQAIRDGSFQVNSSVVADKLISSVNDMFGTKH